MTQEQDDAMRSTEGNGASAPVHDSSTDVYVPGASACIISAIERIQTSQVTKSGAGGLVDMLKGISVGYLGERDDQLRRIASLETDLARVTSERDTARSKLADLRDINILHTLVLAIGTGMLGCYASYDSAGKGSDFSILFWFGVGCFALWLGFLVYRIAKR